MRISIWLLRCQSLTWFHALPYFPASSIVVLFQICFTLPLLLAPCRFQSKACSSKHSSPFLRVWPIHCHSLILIYIITDITSVAYHSLVLLIILGNLTYLLTYSMVQSSSWEANWFAASQEIPRILWNLKVHYRTHKPPPPVPILCQPNPVHIPTSHLLEINPNIIHPPMPRSPQWSLSLWFPYQDPICPPLFTHTRHMPSPSHSSRFYHPHDIGWGVQII